MTRHGEKGDRTQPVSSTSAAKTDSVVITDGEARVSTLTIAEGTENEHKNVLELVRAYQRDLEEFGRVAFETRPFETAGGVQSREVANLNDQQATLIMTYMKNTEIVRSFKKQETQRGCAPHY